MFPYLLPLLLLCMISVCGGAGKCGTPLIFQPPPLSGELLKQAPPRPVAPDWAARTYTTDNFTIHYALTGPHRVRIDMSDSLVFEEFESLYGEQSPDLTDREKQQAAYSQMDTQANDHPVFITRMGEYFELARSEYLDNLNMKLAETTQPSPFFEVPATRGKHQVDVVDISAAEGYDGFELYGLNYPPGEGEGIVMENDFLFNLGTQAFPNYTAITSVYNRGPVSQTIDYTIDWDKGLKVTAVHEFYHSIQYAYTPSLADFHFWYEASATGREESLAPEVNDYLQYLPNLIDRHKSSSLTRNCDVCLEPYGNGIFFTYLLQKLGQNIDEEIWQGLENGLEIEKAMAAVFQQHNTSMASLYPGFTQPMAFNQTGSPNPFETYSEDTPVWPVLRRDEMDLEEKDTLLLNMLPLTYTVYNITRGNSGRSRSIELVSGEHMTAATVMAGKVTVQDLDSNQQGFIMPLPVSDQDDNVLIISNNSWFESADLKIIPFGVVEDTRIIPFPNPYTIKGTSANLLFTRPGEADSLTEVNVYNEFGLGVNAFTLDMASEDWSWNLTDSAGSLLLPGVYFIKPDGEPVKPLLVLMGD